MNPVVVVWCPVGDEARAKSLIIRPARSIHIARVAGGHNAGNTVIIGKTLRSQLIPCAPETQATRHHRSGVVIDLPPSLPKFEMLEKAHLASPAACTSAIRP